MTRRLVQLALSLLIVTGPAFAAEAPRKTENVVAAKQAGVSNYIVKPFNAETLKEKIEKVAVHA